MDEIALLNLVIALARKAGIDPEELAELFNERDDNQAYLDQLVSYQHALDKKTDFRRK